MTSLPKARRTNPWIWPWRKSPNLVWIARDCGEGCRWSSTSLLQSLHLHCLELCIGSYWLAMSLTAGFDRFCSSLLPPMLFWAWLRLVSSLFFASVLLRSNGRKVHFLDLKVARHRTWLPIPAIFQMHLRTMDGVRQTWQNSELEFHCHHHTQGYKLECSPKQSPTPLCSRGLAFCLLLHSFVSSALTQMTRGLLGAGFSFFSTWGHCGFPYRLPMPVLDSVLELCIFWSGTVNAIQLKHSAASWRMCGCSVAHKACADHVWLW